MKVAPPPPKGGQKNLTPFKHQKIVIVGMVELLHWYSNTLKLFQCVSQLILHTVYYVGWVNSGYNITCYRHRKWTLSK